MIWSEIETLPRSEIEKIQLERLQETVHRVYEKVPAYRKKMDAVGIKPDDIKTLADTFVKTLVARNHSRIEYPDED